MGFLWIGLRKLQFSFSTYQNLSKRIRVYMCVIIENYTAFFHVPPLEIFQLLGETSGQVHFLT